jgi:hypothetical protein
VLTNGIAALVGINLSQDWKIEKKSPIIPKTTLKRDDRMGDQTDP